MVTSPVSAELIDSVTLSKGWDAKVTLKLSVEPDSETVVELLDSVTVMPTVSSSVVVTEMAHHIIL